ncbi:MAG: phage holin family protein [Luteolibacter sp.]
MNPSSEKDSPPFEATRSVPGSRDPSLPSNWREALMSLIASRVTLIQLESKDATRAGAKSIAYLIAAICCVVFAWALLIAGLVAFLSANQGWPWYGVTIGAGVLHLLIGILLATLVKPSGATSFPITRAEFQKDREWIENFQQTKKSND